MEIKNKTFNKKIIIASLFLLAMIFWLGGMVVQSKIIKQTHHHKKTEQDINNRRVAFVSEKEEVIKKLINQGKYKCCLKTPCVRCLGKNPKEGQELVCDCLEDIMNGKHPCGECLGEILEGEGNPLIAEYFATAIAEKLGDEYLLTLKQIVEQKYDMPIEKQL